MNTTQLRCFFAAARFLNFSQSASELYISQPALSQNISSLEKEWEIELFTRNNKRKETYLTPAGKIMYEGMKDLREQFESILHRAKIIQEGKDGTLHIGIFGGDRVDERVLTSLDFFQEKYPKIELSLLRGTNNDLIRGLFNSTIDVAFALKIDVEEKKWLVYQELFKLNTVLLVNVKHPLAKKENLSLSDFRDDTFISISSDQSPAINSLLKQECEKAGFAPKIIDAPDTNSQILYLQAGKGVAICSLNNIAVYKSRIMPLPLRELKSLDFGIVWNSTNDNPCIELFVSAYELIE